jgi:hypothetical protein
MFCNTVSDYNSVQKCLVGQKTEDRRQKTEDPSSLSELRRGKQKAEDGRQRTEFRSGNEWKSEVGMNGSRKWECGSGKWECGSWTRRRPIGRDYAAAKDAEVGKKTCRRPIRLDYAATKDAKFVKGFKAWAQGSRRKN